LFSNRSIVWLKGWQQYYGRFHGSALKPVWRNMNMFLTRWLMRKHKKLAGHKTRAAQDLNSPARNVGRGHQALCRRWRYP
jgi:Group II intron, maturase-specific domain